MATARFRFEFLDGGGSVTGPVMGSGGFISDVARLDAAARLAAGGRPTGLYEPAAGCVAVYPDYCAESNGTPYQVRLSEVRWTRVVDR